MDLILWGRGWALVWILAACRGKSEEDEKRPYKFAFAIEGYQHRSEEKDERGIIMGEFGFVTGDGVYHVTVYATDENGNFKILKMKNYYIGLPGEGTTVAPSRAPPPTTRPTTPAPLPPSTTKSAVMKHLEGLMGCSGCIIPIKNNKDGSVTETTPAPNYGEGLIDNRFGDGNDKRPGSTGGSPGGTFGSGKPSNRPGTVGGSGVTSGGVGGTGVSGGGGSSSYPGTGGGGSSSYPGAGGGGGIKGGGVGGGITGGGAGGSSSPGVGGVGGGGSGVGFPGQTSSGGNNYKNPSSLSTPGSNPGGSYDPSQPGKPGVPGVSNQPGSPNYSGNLPPGMTMEELMGLLYKFNYTLKYHGHHESGYRNGDKEGAYFFNGRDGLGRNVKYIANEFGFQPNITLVDLGLKSPDTPQGENEENELRGNEFKWFYKR